MGHSSPYPQGSGAPSPFLSEEGLNRYLVQIHTPPPCSLPSPEAPRLFRNQLPAWLSPPSASPLGSRPCHSVRPRGSLSSASLGLGSQDALTSLASSTSFSLHFPISQLCLCPGWIPQEQLPRPGHTGLLPSTCVLTCFLGGCPQPSSIILPRPLGICRPLNLLPTTPQDLDPSLPPHPDCLGPPYPPGSPCHPAPGLPSSPPLSWTPRPGPALPSPSPLSWTPLQGSAFSPFSNFPPRSTIDDLSKTQPQPCLCFSNPGMSLQGPQDGLPQHQAL